MGISFDFSNALSFLPISDVDSLSKTVKAAHDSLYDQNGPNAGCLGWVDLPIRHDKAEFERIKSTAERIRKESQALVVIGIGGSYLGARAAIEALSHSFYNQLSGSTQVYFAGQNMSSKYLSHLLEILEGKDISINVISKSGSTFETALSFRIFKEYMEKKYGIEGARKRIYVTTHKMRGPLKALADVEGYETFSIPDDVGGRYSILTAAGLLPIAVAGLNIGRMMEGARSAYHNYNNPVLWDNDCYQYAAFRNALYRKGKIIELMVTYEPSHHYLAEWWKQLFGESEGKEHKGLFPSSVSYPTDLHSLGQYIQEGRRDLFETVLHVNTQHEQITIQHDLGNFDGLNYLADKTFHELSQITFQGVLQAHVTGGAPNLIIEVDEMNEYTFGELVVFFQMSCGISGSLLGVNPFDQPGVEAYKNNIKAILNG
ncbi:glucose-6-phosphate isomerase [Brevibacillus panacihumi]|uniref:glucose-6-phosphate isomerase n=1 Tax=Brevibacillus panacihumi TaxID=497735 RepID=UPI003D25F65A